MNLTGLFLRSASDSGTAISESSAILSTSAYSSSELKSGLIASRTLELNLYGLAVDAMIVLAVSPVALR